MLVSPADVIKSAYGNRDLIFRLARREIEARYRGSIFGMLWAVFLPLLMMAIYTFVFSVVLAARWGGSTNTGESALLILSGILCFSLFAESFGRAPTLVLENPSYVKKVVFPLEILTYVSMLVTLFNFVVGLAVLLIFQVFVLGVPPVSALAVPIIIAPIVLGSQGLSWIVSSIGVFLRDANQVAGVITTAVMFLSPIFYPIAAVPEKFRWALHVNPLAGGLEGLRSALFFGKWPSLESLLIQYAVGFGLAWLGISWFMRTKKAFSDVL